MHVVNIDGITITIPILQSQVLQLKSNLNFKDAYDQYSSETNFKYLLKLSDFNVKNSLILSIKHNKETGYNLIITGSLHKYYHGKNSNLFYENELEAVIKSIENALSMKIAYVHPDMNSKRTNSSLFSEFVFKPVKQISLRLSKVELAINIETGMDDVYSYLKDNLIQHKRKRFTCDDGLVFRCKHDDYVIKLYEKEKGILRYEIVFFTKELRRCDIYNLPDLIHHNIQKLAVRLKKEAREIIFADGIDIYTAEGLTKKEEIKLLRFTNEWYQDAYLFNKSREVGRKKKNMIQKMYRIGVGSKNILAEKGAGYKDEFVKLVNQKVDELFFVEAV